MTDDLGFDAPTSRRDLTALRSALEKLNSGATVTATYRIAEHGRFHVTGPARRDLTDTAFKVGWWDLTSGKGAEPVADLQALVVASTDDAAPGPATTDPVELRDAVSDLAAGDVVTADFEFEGCGAFTISGGVRRDTVGTRWVLAGHHLNSGDVPAPRLRRLVVERTDTGAVAASSRSDLVGA